MTFSAPLYNLMLKILNFNKNTLFYIINKELYNGARCQHIITLRKKKREINFFLHFFSYNST